MWYDVCKIIPYAFRQHRTYTWQLVICTHDVSHIVIVAHVCAADKCVSCDRASGNSVNSNYSLGIHTRPRPRRWWWCEYMQSIKIQMRLHYLMCVVYSLHTYAAHDRCFPTSLKRNQESRTNNCIHYTTTNSHQLKPPKLSSPPYPLPLPLSPSCPIYSRGCRWLSILDCMLKPGTTRLQERSRLFVTYDVWLSCICFFFFV